jgi:hypothetical protein
MKNAAKLFEAPRGSKENEKATIRAKLYNETYGELSSEWNARLISSGLDASIVHDLDNARMVSDSYSPEGEEQFILYARWYWTASNEVFEFQRCSVAETKRIWKLFAIHGKNEREIADSLSIPHSSVHDRIKALEERCKLDVRAGKLNSTHSTPAEEKDWARLQELKSKHLRLVRQPNFGQQLADRLIDSGCLVPRPLPSEAIEALNNVTASLALALGGSK